MTFNEKVNHYYDKLLEETPTEVADWVAGEEGQDFVTSLFIMADDGEVTRFDIGMMLKDYGVRADASYIQHFIQMLAKAEYQVT